METVLELEPKIMLPDFAHLNDVDVLRNMIHEKMIERLVELYGTEKWKYTFIKSVKVKFNKKIQYRQLNEFEKGNSRNENVMMLIVLEILSLRSQIKLEVESEGADFLKVKIK